MSNLPSPKMQRLTAPITQALTLYPSLHVPPSLQSRYSSLSHTPLNIDMALPPEGIYSSKERSFQSH